MGTTRTSSSAKRLRIDWSERGTTLFELLVVLAIMALVAALAAPRFGAAASGARLKATVNQLVADIKAARDRSDRLGEQVVFEVDAAGWGSEAVGVKEAWPSDIRFNGGGPATLQFPSDDKFGKVRIELMRRDETATIVVGGFSGQVSVSFGQR